MNELSIWNGDSQLDKIKKLFANDLTDNEFQTFIGIGKATGLNPFLREIWAVKFGGKPANIFIGRDGYRKSAQSNKEYDYHSVDAVYENDKFEVKNGEVEHSYNFTNRGKLVGAYCIVKRKSSSKAMFSFVELGEYDTKQSIWKTKPATMIKKVAEAQGLRQAFQELFAGTYDESEDWNDKENVKIEKVIDKEKQEENYISFCEKMGNVKSIEELKKVYTDFQSEIKNNKDFVSLDRKKELVKIKDEIKDFLENGEVVDVEIEVEETK